MRRCGLIRALVISVWLAFMCFWMPGTLSTRAQVVSARAGRVTRTEGEVLLQCVNEKEIRQLPKGVQLHDGDVVLTTGNARAAWALNPNSYVQVGADSYVRVYRTKLDEMHFDIERGEVIVIVRALRNGAALVLHTPPGLLTVHKPGRYRFRVATNGETEAAVVKGELRYVDKGKVTSLKRRMRVNFYKVQRKVTHGA